MKWSESRSVMSNSLQPHGLYSPWNSPGDLPNPGIKPRSPTLQVDSLPSEPPGKPLEWPSSRSLQIINAWRVCGEKGTLLHCWWEWKLGSRYGKQNGITIWSSSPSPLVYIQKWWKLFWKDTCNKVEDLEIFILSKTQKDNYMLPFICGL